MCAQDPRKSRLKPALSFDLNREVWRENRLREITVEDTVEDTVELE